MLPARQCCLPLSAHSEVHHTFSSALLLIEAALAPRLASHLGSCEPVAKRGPAEPAGAASCPTSLHANPTACDSGDPCMPLLQPQ